MDCIRPIIQDVVEDVLIGSAEEVIRCSINEAFEIVGWTGIRRDDAILDKSVARILKNPNGRLEPSACASRSILGFTVCDMLFGEVNDGNSSSVPELNSINVGLGGAGVKIAVFFVLKGRNRVNGDFPRTKVYLDAFIPLGDSPVSVIALQGLQNIGTEMHPPISSRRIRTCLELSLVYIQCGNVLEKCSVRQHYRIYVTVTENICRVPIRPLEENIGVQ